MAQEPTTRELLRITETDIFDESQARSKLNDGWQTLHRLLRGRYLWLIPVGLIVTLGGTIWGWRHGEKLYSSMGVVHVIPVLPTVLDSDGEHGEMPMFDAFAETQAALINSRTVVDAALRQPEWTALKGQPTDADVLNFMNGLKVERKLELINVTYTNADPDVALVGVSTLVNEYERLYQELDARADERRMNLLKQMQASLTQRAADVQTQITALSDAVGADNLQALYESKLTYLRELDSKIQDDELELAQFGSTGLRGKTLTERRDALALERDKTREELAVVGKQNARMTTLNQTADSIRSQADEVRRRIERLSVESPASGRVEIITSGARPLSPDKDSRLLRAAVGGLGGALGTLVFFVLLGLTDSRIRLPQDLPSRLRSATVLGMLPRLPRNSDDPIRAAAAAHCVQQIRTMVQLWCASHNKKVLTVSSAASGSGKTTLTMALGVSCAASGCRTLLIDCDLVGAELSRSFRATVKRRIGSILRREGLITEQQLASALERAAIFKQRVGEVLVESGMLSERDLERTLAEQERHEVGLLDAVAGDPLAECVSHSVVNGLDVLPVGSATAGHATTLSQVTLKRMLVEARKSYDVILIDTGPLPGSIEAAVATAASDGVILTVTSGERRGSLGRTLARLNTLSCEVVGVVFNRVRRAEEAHLSSSGRSSEAVVQSAESTPVAGHLRETAHLGPIERAVISSVPERSATLARFE